MKTKGKDTLTNLFINQLKQLPYDHNTDPNWTLLFKNEQNRWYYLHISRYQNVYYVSQVIGESVNIEINKEREMAEGKSFNRSSNYVENNYWEKLFALAIVHIKKIIQNPLKTYVDLNKTFPYKYRTGIVKKSVLWRFDKDLFRYDKELTKKQLTQFCKLAENYGFTSYSNVVLNLTANKYFEICKIAYLYSDLKLTDAQKKSSGKILYNTFADGRHEGLLDIDLNSTEEFYQWVNHKHPKYNSGGHPYEILRGGNTTKISLSVEADRIGDKKEYKLNLWGPASSRLAETIRIALGLHKNGIKVNIDEPELIRDRLLGQDYIGVMPEYASLHRGNQTFEKKLADVIHLDNVKRKGQKLYDLITWDDLPFPFPMIK